MPNFTYHNENQLLKLKETLLIFILILSQITLLLSQGGITGNYVVKNFGKSETGIGTQNWDIESLTNGIMLFANNGGLLRYDGIHWDLHPLPNKTIARSIAIMDNQTIFVGGQDEIGYFDKQFVFHSIREQIPKEHLPLEDVWQMIHLENSIYFRSVNKVFHYDLSSGVIKVVDPKSTVTAILKYQDEVYFHDPDHGLRTIKGENTVKAGTEFFKNMEVLNILKLKDRTLYLTKEHGIFIEKKGSFEPLNASLHNYVIKNKLIGAFAVKGEELTLGTQFDAIIKINSEGDILAKINKSTGLINNNIQAIKLDARENLWVGTANGIAEISVDGHLTELQPDSDHSSTYYAIKKHNNKIYFASNNGVYVAEDKMNAPFKIVQNTAGQAWGLNVVDGSLFLGHNNGALKITDASATLLSDIPGAWKFLPTSQEGYMYVGTYTGIDIYKKENDNWVFAKHIKGFEESSRIIISVKKNEVWVSHPYRGVYRITHDDDFNTTEVRPYAAERGLPSSMLNYIFDIDDVPYVTAKKGIYKYNQPTDEFIADELLNGLIDSTQNVRRLLQDKKGDIWFIGESEVGVLKNRKDGNYDKVVYPELLGELVGGFEHLEFIDSNRVFGCTDRNVLILDTSKKPPAKAPSLNFREISLIENHDSLLFENGPVLTFDQNALRFYYNSPDHSNGIEYKHNLRRNNKDHPSTWSTDAQKDFTNLAPGDYDFEVQARTANGDLSAVRNFSFKILPPWYLSLKVKIIYSVLLFGGLLALILIPRFRYKKDKDVLIEAKIQTEEELEKVKTEQLSAELASSTLHLVQKNETISKIRVELDNFKEKIKDANLKKEIKKVLSVVNDDAQMENDWENFSHHFDQVHTNFVSRLTTEYPEITPKDTKLCAYLRMNLTTKEIAPLLHISIRGVEISRYRLRKKLSLEKEVNLNEFMMNY